MTLYTRVTQKTLADLKDDGHRRKKLLTPEDDYEALKEFNRPTKGPTSAVEEMHLEYQGLLDEITGPRRDSGACFPAHFQREAATAKRLRGVFFCFALPALDKELRRVHGRRPVPPVGISADSERDAILEEPAEIVESIRSTPDTRRLCITEQRTLVEMRDAVMKHIKNTYLKRVDAPVGVGRACNVGWN